MASYTYHLGKRIELTASPRQFVSRAPAVKLRERTLNPIRKLSAHSYLVDAGDEPEQRIALARRLGAPAYPDYRRRESGVRLAVTDRIFVRFKDRTSLSPAKAFGAEKKLDVLTNYSDHDYLYRIQNVDADPVSVVNDLTENDRNVVAVVDHDVNFLAKLATHLDPGCEEQWYLKEVGGLASVAAESAWGLMESEGSPDVVIGMIDAGFDIQNQEFSREKFPGCAYLIDGDVFVRDRLTDETLFRMRSDTLHGTHCAITAVAEINGFGGAGAAPRCRLFPVNCEHENGFIRMSPSKFLEIVQLIGDKVDVISNSWDLGAEQLWPAAAGAFLTKQIESGGRRRKGLVFVWAAGNDNRPIDFEASMDVPFAHETVNGRVEPRFTRVFRNPLAKIPGIVHVGAVSSELQRCHYSNYGYGLTLCGPSSNRHTYDPDAFPLPGKKFVLPGGFAQDFSGTSAAAAIVAGVAALVISANPDLTAREVVSILKKTADKTLGVDFRYERYRPKGDAAPVAWDISPIPPFDDGTFRDEGDSDGTWSPWFGHGRVNAFKAVQMANEKKKKKGERNGR